MGCASERSPFLYLSAIQNMIFRQVWVGNLVCNDLNIELSLSVWELLQYSNFRVILCMLNLIIKKYGLVFYHSF